MHDLKYFLIILFSFLLTGFTSCINPESVPDVLSSLPSSEEEGEIIPSPSSETSSEESLAECIEGVYGADVTFKRRPPNNAPRNGENSKPYTLEVSHNSNELIFLVTSEGDQLCTTYLNPSFSVSDENNNHSFFYIESDSVEHKGIISDTTGMFDMRADQNKREPMVCSLWRIHFYQPIDRPASYATERPSYNEAPTAYTGNIFGLTKNELRRSFAEIKSDCDALATVDHEDIPAQGGAQLDKKTETV